jgi:hypothetical protein
MLLAYVATSASSDEQGTNEGYYEMEEEALEVLL